MALGPDLPLSPLLDGKAVLDEGVRRDLEMRTRTNRRNGVGDLLRRNRDEAEGNSQSSLMRTTTLRLMRGMDRWSVQVDAANVVVGRRLGIVEVATSIRASKLALIQCEDEEDAGGSAMIVVVAAGSCLLS